MSCLDIPITVLYKKEVRHLLNTVLKLVVLQTIFNITSTNFYLQGYSGGIYYSNQGEFLNIKEDILIIQPFPDQAKLETMNINNTDSRFVFSNGEFIHDYLSTGFSSKNQNFRKTLIRFDDIKSLIGKKIIKVYLRLTGRFRSFSFLDTPKEVFVHRIEQKYGNITKWSETPAYNPKPYSSIIIREYNEEVFSWDITLLVKGWIDGSYPNYGLLLKQNDPFGEESTKEFYLSQKWPYLNIIYFAA